MKSCCVYILIVLVEINTICAYDVPLLPNDDLHIKEPELSNSAGLLRRVKRSDDEKDDDTKSAKDTTEKDADAKESAQSAEKKSSDEEVSKEESSDETSKDDKADKDSSDKEEQKGDKGEQKGDKEEQKSDKEIPEAFPVKKIKRGAEDRVLGPESFLDLTLK